MSKWNTVTNYDSSATAYDQLRVPGQSILKALRKIFAGVSPTGQVLSLGCGTGQYESSLFNPGNVVGLDMSRGMLNIAKDRMEKCLRANMVELPFGSHLFQGVYFVHSLHHVGGNLKVSSETRNKMRKQTLQEAVRVVKNGPLAIVQRDPSQSAAIWFFRYFPRALETKLVLQPKVKTLINWLKELGVKSVSATPVEEPMIQGFYEWDSPLHPEFRKSFSEFSYLTEEEVEEGMAKLRENAKKGLVEAHIEECRQRFSKLEYGGTYVISGRIDRDTP